MDRNGTAIAVSPNSTVPDAILEMIVGGGDLGKLSPAQRTEYLVAFCTSIGLNALSRPIEFISLNGKLVPYAKRDCTDQLRKINKVSISIVDKITVEGVFTVTARATTPDGRTDEDFGSVTVAGLKGDALCNATMKAITKAKRRVTLSICGLGLLDETEVDTIPGAVTVPIEVEKSTPVQAAPIGIVNQMNATQKLIENYKAEIAAVTTLPELEKIANRLKGEQAMIKNTVAPFGSAKREELEAAEEDKSHE